MAIIYKLWLHIEQVDDEHDDYQDIGEPIELGCSESHDDIVYLRDKVIELYDAKKGV